MRTQKYKTTARSARPALKILVDIAKNEWNHIERYIFESYHLIQGLKIRDVVTVS